MSRPIQIAARGGLKSITQPLHVAVSIERLACIPRPLDTGTFPLTCLHGRHFGKTRLTLIRVDAGQDDLHRRKAPWHQERQGGRYASTPISAAHSTHNKTKGSDELQARRLWGNWPSILWGDLCASGGARMIAAKIAGAAFQGRISIAVVAILIALLGGCATHSGSPPYPDDWPTLKSPATSEGCPLMAGTYANRPIQVIPSSSVVLPLSEVFAAILRPHPKDDPSLYKKHLWPAIPRDAEAVSIDQTEHRLIITIIGIAGERVSLGFRRFTFSLTEDRYDDLYACVAFHGEPRARFLVERGEAPSHWVTLAKAVDGSLIVNWRSAPAGTIAAHAVSSIWYRYAPREPSVPTVVR